MSYEIVHTFAANPLDRSEALRRDEVLIDTLMEHPEARFLPFQKLRVAVSQANDLAWHQASEVMHHESHQVVFLGMADDAPHFAVDLVEQSIVHEFSDCRQIAAHLSTADTGIVAQARAQLD